MSICHCYRWADCATKVRWTGRRTLRSMLYVKQYTWLKNASLHLLLCYHHLEEGFQPLILSKWKPCDNLVLWPWSIYLARLVCLSIFLLLDSLCHFRSCVFFLSLSFPRTGRALQELHSFMPLWLVSCIDLIMASTLHPFPSKTVYDQAHHFGVSVCPQHHFYFIQQAN